MDTSLVEEDCINAIDDGRSSGGSSEGFTFSSTLDLRKNLTETFDQISSAPAPAKRPSSTATASSNLTVTDRIAQFEHVATKNQIKPPLPAKQQPNAIPQNSMSVYLRIRPPTAGTTKDSKAVTNSAPVNTIEVLPPTRPNVHPTTVRTYPPAQSNLSKVNINRENDPSMCAKEFSFHQVLEPGTTQKATYSTVAAPLIQSLFEATTGKTDKATKSKHPSAQIESALLFSYGITNAGKTHTIIGNVKGANEAKWGIIPRAISDCFDHMKQLPKVPCHYDLYASFFEIYNEQIFDLLPKKAPKGQFIGPPPALKVRERPGQTIIRGLARHKVRDVNHGIELTQVANAKRHTTSNNLNRDSSRSHSVCQLQLVPRTIHPAVKTADDDSVISMSGYSTDEEASFLTKHKSATLWIVDLAGSERSKRTGLGNERQKESSQINKSLMTLMRCLSVMRESTQRQGSAAVVPYRESKLTHLFMNHLTGHSAARTSMIVNVNPSVPDFDETQHVLSYASKARLIEMDQVELGKKRKQYFGDEYDLNGHKRTKKTKGNSKAVAAKSFVKKVAKALSPKKLAKKLSPRKRNETAKISKNPSFNNKNESSRALLGKRKAGETSSLERSDSTVSNDQPETKRMRHPPASSTLKTDEAEKEIKSLKLALSIAQAEVEILKNEKTKLQEEFNLQEAQVREEVANEMEEQLKATHDQYNDVIERLRLQIHANPTAPRSTRKAQMDRAEQQIEELMDKIDECEEEMARMRQDHAEEIAALKAQLEAKPEAASSTENENDKIAKLEAELKASREEVARLTKSKEALIESYEKLLQGGDEGDESSSDEESTPTKSNRIPPWKRGPVQAENAPVYSNSRRPLTSITSNSKSDSSRDFDAEDSSSWNLQGKREQWVFPKNPTSQDRNGIYRRPSGRAPGGREWDENVGAWRLKSAV